MATLVKRFQKRNPLPAIELATSRFAEIRFLYQFGIQGPNPADMLPGLGLITAVTYSDVRITPEGRTSACCVNEFVCRAVE